MSEGQSKAVNHLFQSFNNVYLLGEDKALAPYSQSPLRVTLSGFQGLRITNFYNTVNPVSPNGAINTNGLRFGEWLAQKSFQEQMEWGLRIMQWMK